MASTQVTDINPIPLPHVTECDKATFEISRTESGLIVDIVAKPGCQLPDSHYLKQGLEDIFGVPAIRIGLTPKARRPRFDRRRRRNLGPVAATASNGQG